MTNGARTLLTMRDARKAYGGRVVLEIERLEFGNDERVLIGGDNGSGKSTLLRVLAGVSSLTRGTVVREADLAGLRVGYVPQSGGLYPEWSLRRNLAVRRELYGCGPVDLGAAWYLEDLGLGAELDRPVGELSGGFQRLASFAAALHVEPGWLLLDEPFDGLDERHRGALMDALRRLDAALRLVVVAAPQAGDYPEAGRVLRLEQGRPA